MRFKNAQIMCLKQKDDFGININELIYLINKTQHI